jgi:GNAT superfamily N-acetyltransferase
VRDGGEAEHLQAAARVLCDYRAEVTFERVHLLREGRDDENRRVWRPLADAPFAAPAVIGRGGLELELTVTDALDPAGRAFQRREWAMVNHDRQGATLPRDLAVTARREGEVVGTAVGWTSGPRVHLGDLIVAAVHRRQGVGAHLVAGFLSEAIQRGCHRAWARTEAGGPAEAFWRRLGWIGEDRLEAYDEGRDFLQLRRDL